MMNAPPRRAAVIGSGVMGAALAAHLANAGIPTLLLDIVPPEDSGVDGDPASPEYRNAFASRGLARAQKAKPAAFYTPEAARLVSVGNLEDDAERIADVDWVLEAIVENLDVKRTLFERIVPHLAPHAILTTNTSGLSITDMAAVLPAPVQPRFLGTHFFNPPRYLRLLELVPHAGTDPGVLATMRAFGENVLGKGTVVTKDTPNFIANRVGGFAVMSVIRAMIDGGYTIEEVDALTGPVIGRPRSATFRTADIVGLDILVNASQTVYERATDDECRDYFSPPELIQRMIKEDMLGDKTGSGFYRKIKKDGKSVILTLDLDSFEYRERQKPSLGSLDVARSVEETGPRIQALIKGKDRAGEFVWRTLSEALVYAANRLGEVADDVVSIDRAMKWGFGWELGPFEIWDAIGVDAVVKRLEKEKREVPAVVREVLASETGSFYQRGKDHSLSYFDHGKRTSVDASATAIDLDAARARGKVIKKNAGASLIDIGDGVVCLEFHSRMNAIGADILGMMTAAVSEVEKNHEALIIGNYGRNFSVGANLMLLLLEAQEGNWEEIDLVVRQFQKACMALRYSRRPVVAAPFAMTLGGGCEVVLGASAVSAAAETYMGLVEVGVGLIPAGGGCKEMIIRGLEGAPDVEGLDLLSFTRAAFEKIGLAKVSTSGPEAKKMGLLRRSDHIEINPDRLLYSAKEMALGLARQGYRPPDPTLEIPVAGESGIAAIRAQLYNMSEGGFISEYDAYLGEELARVLCGGEVPSGTRVSEQYLLDMEREVFLRLCGQRKTLDRMQHMLKKSKPLRN